MRREVKGLHRKVPESLQHTTPRCNTLQRNLCSAIIVFLGDLLRQRACIVESLQHTTHTTTHYNTLRHTAAHWNTLQRTAIQCNHGKIRDSPKAQISKKVRKWRIGAKSEMTGECPRSGPRGVRKQGLTVKCLKRKLHETEQPAFTEATHRALILGVERVYRNW
jgi:hypothetical protein